MSRATPRVAYFCMEYGLDATFPIYSGGLGILAGDFIKAAHDLAAPVVAVGLCWEHGYGAQRLGADGTPAYDFPAVDAGFLDDTGARVRVRIRGVEVPCAVRMTRRFGHVPLVLLQPLRAEDRWITRRLYEAGSDVRIAQELLLGVGGVRALDWLGFDVDVYHFNEGHAVFAGVELIATAMEGGLPFDRAHAAVRRRIVFSTHTPVPAGNESHALADLRRLGACLELSDSEMRRLGGDPFNMTVAGLRLARAANAVSELHGATARAMWAGVEDAAPIVPVTNGVHAGTWQAPAVREARNPDALAAARGPLRAALATEVARRGGPAIDPGDLVVGIARRVVAYKRNDLLLRDEARLDAMFQRSPVRLLFAGKAHPDDAAGREIVARLARARHRWPGRVEFLENYDMALGRLLTQGCDVWLNHPVRPLEACGTSGMKAALNGGLNLSILDGWWAEACVHGGNGWAIGGDDAGTDAGDLDALFTVLEREVVPAWADPSRWRAMMWRAVQDAGARFTAARMVEDYYAKLYAPAASASATATAASRAT